MTVSKSVTYLSEYKTRIVFIDHLLKIGIAL